MLSFVGSELLPSTIMAALHLAARDDTPASAASEGASASQGASATTQVGTLDDAYALVLALPGLYPPLFRSAYEAAVKELTNRPCIPQQCGHWALPSMCWLPPPPGAEERGLFSIGEAAEGKESARPFVLPCYHVCCALTPTASAEGSSRAALAQLGVKAWSPHFLANFLKMPTTTVETLWRQPHIGGAAAWLGSLVKVPLVRTVSRSRDQRPGVLFLRRPGGAPALLLRRTCT